MARRQARRRPANLDLRAYPVGAVVLSSEGLVLDFNRAVQEFFGWEPDEARGRAMEPAVKPGGEVRSADGGRAQVLVCPVEWDGVPARLVLLLPWPGQEERRTQTLEDQVASLQAQLALAEQRAKDAAEALRDTRLRGEQFRLELHRLKPRLSQAEERARQAEERVRQLAFQDPLTGLPSLRQFQQYLERAIEQVHRSRRSAALMLIDLDHFRALNHAIGSEAGDRLLVDVSGRLQESARELDLVARRGEGEFLVLVPELNGVQAGEAAAGRMLSALSRPFTVGDQPLSLRASIGISLIPADADSAQEALQHAGKAALRARELGGHRCAVYLDKLGRRPARKPTRLQDVEHGLEAGEFFLEYQPFVRFNRAVGLTEGFQASLAGVEALLRWEHRMEGVVGPEHFMPVAEETGLGIRLRRWMIREACQQVRRWREKGLSVLLSVDLSPRQLVLQSDLVPFVTEQVRQAGLKPRSLIVGIAEDFYTEAAERVGEMLGLISQAGIGVALDDFGLRLGSLGRLHSKYTQIVKIAPELVATCTQNNACLAAINLARSLDMVPLAKGVETPEQARFLARRGCVMGQGGCFSAPLEPDALLDLIGRKSTWRL